MEVFWADSEGVLDEMVLFFGVIDVLDDDVVHTADEKDMHALGERCVRPRVSPSSSRRRRRKKLYTIRENGESSRSFLT